MKNRYTICILTCVMAALLSSCASDPGNDPDYQQLASTAEANPSPNSIVGYWHRTDSQKPPNTTNTTYLFQNNGTGFRTIHSDALEGIVRERARAFTWKYRSGGVWTLQFSDIYMKEAEETVVFRISGDRLLSKSVYFGFISTRTFSRVSQ